MNVAHLHLLLNHVPVIGIPIGAALLAWGMLRAERAVQRAAFGLFVVTGLVAGPVFLSGEPTEKRIEHVAGVVRPMIEEHEDVANAALAATLVLCVTGAASLFITRGGRPLPRLVPRAMLVVAVLASGILAATAYYGGQIRHPELTNQGAPAGGGEAAGEESVSPVQ